MRFLYITTVIVSTLFFGNSFSSSAVLQFDDSPLTCSIGADAIVDVVDRHTSGVLSNDTLVMVWNDYYNNCIKKENE